MILIVEHDPDDLELLCHTFDDLGNTSSIEVARDGLEALDFLFCEGHHGGREAIPPQLVLLGLELPKISGIEVLRTIKSDPRTESIPVAMLSSSHEKRHLTDAYQLGANSYILKPLDFDQFQKTIRAMEHYWLVTNMPGPPGNDPRKIDHEGTLLEK